MDVGINFRQTSGYVTDPVGTTYSLGGAYPETRGGATFGWSTNLVSSRDRSTSIDPRLAGIVFVSSTTINFRFDLPSTGSYDVYQALGDNASANGNEWTLRDDTTTFATFTGSTTAGNFRDAQANVYSAANWPGSNQKVTRTFGSTILRLQCNSVIGNHVVAHLRVVGPSGGGSTESGDASSAGAATAIAAGASLSASAASSTGTGAATAAGASIAAAALSSAGASTATLEGTELSAGVESGALSAAGSATAAAVGASIAAAAASSTGSSTSTLEGTTTGGIESGDISSAGASTATSAGATIAAAAMSSAGASTATAVGADASAATTPTRHDGWLPHSVIARRRRQLDDEDVVALVAMLDQEWREAA